MIKMNDSLGKKANHDSFIDSVPNADIVEKSRLIEIHKGAVIVDIFVVILLCWIHLIIPRCDTPMIGIKRLNYGTLLRQFHDSPLDEGPSPITDPNFAFQSINITFFIEIFRI